MTLHTLRTLRNIENLHPYCSSCTDIREANGLAHIKADVFFGVNSWREDGLCKECLVKAIELSEKVK